MMKLHVIATTKLPIAISSVKNMQMSDTDTQNCCNIWWCFIFFSE